MSTERREFLFKIAKEIVLWSSTCVFGFVYLVKSSVILLNTDIGLSTAFREVFENEITLLLYKISLVAFPILTVIYYQRSIKNR